MNAWLYVSGESIPQRMTVGLPAASTLTETFPWLTPASTAGDGPDPLEEQFANFAAEASEWAELTLGAAFETWPDE